jgi:hypothetical protein
MRKELDTLPREMTSDVPNGSQNNLTGQFCLRMVIFFVEPDIQFPFILVRDRWLGPGVLGRFVPKRNGKHHAKEACATRCPGTVNTPGAPIPIANN